MSEAQPIKRSKELAPLSREHHDSLLFAWKIKQGISKQVEADRMTRFCQWFLEHHLKAHFEKEETAFDQILALSHPMMEKMVSEHNVIKSIINSIGNAPTYEALKQLAQLITDHIRFEERALFAEVEKVATPEQLVCLKMANQADEETDNATWQDEFWVRK